MERNERLQLRRMFSSIDRDGSGALDLMEMGVSIYCISVDLQFIVIVYFFF